MTASSVNSSANISAKEGHHGVVNMFAVGKYLRHGRSRQVAARCTWKRLTDAVVVGVEQCFEFWMEDLVVSSEWLQQKGFEKPACVSQMPLGWAGIDHGLHAIVFHLQRSGE